MFLLKESQWIAVQQSSIKNLRQSNISNFDQCYSNYECSSDLVNANTLMHFITSNDQLNKLTIKNLTCADIAFYNQFGHNQIKNKIEHKYLDVLMTHRCMNRTVNDFQIKLQNLLSQQNHLNQLNYLNQQNKNTTQFNFLTNPTQFSQLSQISHLNLPKIFQKTDQTKYLNISIVPRRCFDCIRTANSYNSQNNEQACLHPLQKCGAYAINFEYFTQVNGNLVTKHILAKLYNSTSEQENQNQILDTLDLLNKISNVDNKQFRKESSDLKSDELKDDYDDYKMDYNKKLSQLLDFDYVPIIAKSIQFDKLQKPKRKNSKLLNRLIGNRSKNRIKSRRNSKFSRELQDQIIYKSISMNEELSVQKLISTASYQNFVNCVSNLKCSEQLINIYVKQHQADCNLDSTIDCDDFASLHWLGKKNCKQNTMLYSNLWKNFEYCSILADDVRKETGKDVLKEELAVNDEMNDKNDKNYYEITHNSEPSNSELPIFQVRPNLQPMVNVTISNEATFHPDLNQYYSSHVVDLSTDCLQCICEASSNYNCSQVLNPPSNFYFSSYKIAPPPQIVYLKTNNRMPKITSLNTLSQMNSLKRNLIKLIRNSDLEANLDDKFKLCDNDKQGCGPFSITKLHFLESMTNTFWYRGAAGDWERCAESIGI